MQLYGTRFYDEQGDCVHLLGLFLSVQCLDGFKHILQWERQHTSLDALCPLNIKHVFTAGLE